MEGISLGLCPALIFINYGLRMGLSIGDEIRIAAHPTAPSMRDFSDNIIARFETLDAKAGAQPYAAIGAKALARKYPGLVPMSVYPELHTN